MKSLVTRLVEDTSESNLGFYIGSFMENTAGATAIEYGLIAAGISVAIIGVVQGLGTKLTATFQSVSDNLK
jgi:pilus assembly protein Flp/PilA